jgi:hypothetical protein
LPVPAVLQSYALSGPLAKGTPVTLTATMNTPGKITFLVNGKRIPGCIGKGASASAPYSATCSWKPTMRGYLDLTFYMVPTDSSLSPVTSGKVRVQAANRASFR